MGKCACVLVCEREFIELCGCQCVNVEIRKCVSVQECKMCRCVRVCKCAKVCKKGKNVK